MKYTNSTLNGELIHSFNLSPDTRDAVKAFEKLEEKFGCVNSYEIRGKVIITNVKLEDYIVDVVVTDCGSVYGNGHNKTYYGEVDFLNRDAILCDIQDLSIIEVLK